MRGIYHNLKLPQYENYVNILYNKKRGAGLFFRISKISVDAVTLLEAIDTSAGIHQLRTAGVERMALGTDFDLKLALGGAALEGLAAGTAHNALAVSRMDILLHDNSPSNLLGAERHPALLLHSGAPEQRTL